MWRAMRLKRATFYAKYMQPKLSLIYNKYVYERVLAVIFYYINKNHKFRNLKILTLNQNLQQITL